MIISDGSAAFNAYCIVGNVDDGTSNIAGLRWTKIESIDVDTIYDVPLKMMEEGLDTITVKKLGPGPLGP